MTFEQFKELLEFAEEEETSEELDLTWHHFRARFQAQARHSVSKAIFNRDQKNIREYVQDVLAHKIWDMCTEAFGPNGPTYTVDDLRKAYEMGHYCWSGNSSGFEYALKEINRRKGLAK